MNLTNFYSFIFKAIHPTRQILYNDIIEKYEIVEKKTSLYQAILAMKTSKVFVKHNDNIYELNKDILEKVIDAIDKNIDLDMPVIPPEEFKEDVKNLINTLPKDFYLSDILGTHKSEESVINMESTSGKFCDISIDFSGNLYGTIYKALNVVEYSDDPKLQNGYYITFMLSGSAESVSKYKIENLNQKDPHPINIITDVKNPYFIMFLADNKEDAEKQIIKISNKDDPTITTFLRMNNIKFYDYESTKRDPVLTTKQIIFSIKNTGATKNIELQLEGTNMIGKCGNMLFSMDNGLLSTTIDSSSLDQIFTFEIYGTITSCIYNISNIIGIDTDNVDNLSIIKDKSSPDGYMLQYKDIEKFIISGNHNITNMSNMFKDCKLLTECKINHLKDDFDLSTSPMVNEESVRYLLSNVDQV